MQHLEDRELTSEEEASSALSLFTLYYVAVQDRAWRTRWRNPLRDVIRDNLAVATLSHYLGVTTMHVVWEKQTTNEWVSCAGICPWEAKVDYGEGQQGRRGSTNPHSVTPSWIQEI